MVVVTLEVMEVCDGIKFLKVLIAAEVDGWYGVICLEVVGEEVILLTAPAVVTLPIILEECGGFNFLRVDKWAIPRIVIFDEEGGGGINFAINFLCGKKVVMLGKTTKVIVEVDKVEVVVSDVCFNFLRVTMGVIILNEDGCNGINLRIKLLRV